MLEQLFKFLEKLINCIAAFSIGYGLADRKRRALEAQIENHRLKEKLRDNEQENDKIFDGVDPADGIRKIISSKHDS